MGKVVKGIGSVVGTVFKAAGRLIQGVGVITAFAVNPGIGIALIVGGEIFNRIGAAMDPSAPKIEDTFAVERLTASLDPNTPAKIIIGSTATGTDLEYAESGGSKKEFYTQIFAAAGHTIHALDSLYLNDELAVNSSGAVVSPWTGALSYQKRTGTTSQSAIALANNTWPSTATFTGVAHFAVQYNLSKEKVSNGLPQRVTQEGRGALFYDPRRDSTRGGSGLHRTNDQSTWQYEDSGVVLGTNPVLYAIWYLLGWTKAGKLAIGMGVDPEDIDWPQAIAMANICDELVGGKRRYSVSGIESADGGHERVLGNIKASTGIEIRKTAAGVYTFWAPHNDLVSSATITNADIVSAGNHDPGGDLANLFNVAQGQFVDPAALYRARPYPEVREATYVSEDGRDRVLSRDLPFVQDSDVAQRVVRYLIRRSRFQRAWRFGVDYRFLGLNIFDIVTLNCDETASVDQLCRITDIDISTDGVIVLTLLEEAATIYDDTTPPVAMPPASAAPGFDASAKYPVTTLAVTATSISGTAGTSRDAMSVTWDDPGGVVKRTDLQYRKTGTTLWTNAAPARINDTESLILDVEPSTSYDVRARHVSITNVEGGWSQVAQTSGSNQVVGSAASAPWSGITGANKPEDGATVGDPYGASFNLLGSDAGPEHAYTTGYKYLSLEPISNLNLGIGEAISIGVDLKTDGFAGATNRIIVAFFDSSNVFISQKSADATVGITVYERLEISNIEIPLLTSKISVQGDNLQNDAGNYFSKNAMLNRGPVALPYVAPYSDGADVTANNTSADTTLVSGTAAATVKDGAVRANSAIAGSGLALNSGVTQLEPTTGEPRRITNATSVVTGTNAQSFTFSPVRQEIPSIIVTGGGIGEPDPLGSVAAERWWRNIGVKNVTTSGFDLVAEFQGLSASPTVQIDSPASGSPPVIEKSIAEEAIDDNYEYQFDVTVNVKKDIGGGEFEVSTVTIALDTRTTLGGAWTERGEVSYANFTSSIKNLLDQTANVSVDGLGTDAAWRIRVKSTTGNGGSISAFDKVTYNITGGATLVIETATPGIGESPVTIFVAGGKEETVS